MTLPRCKGCSKLVDPTVRNGFCHRCANRGRERDARRRAERAEAEQRRVERGRVFVEMWREAHGGG